MCTAKTINDLFEIYGDISLIDLKIDVGKISDTENFVEYTNENGILFIVKDYTAVRGIVKGGVL